jgi:hypothetical protein
MSPSVTFACGLAATLALALAVVRYLTAPLRRQLHELCGNAERADFWTAFSNVTMVLTPLIFAMSAEPGSVPGVPPLLAVIGQLKWSCIGLVASILMLGWILGRFIARTQTLALVLAGQKSGGIL